MNLKKITIDGFEFIDLRLINSGIIVQNNNTIFLIIQYEKIRGFHIELKEFTVDDFDNNL